MTNPMTPMTRLDAVNQMLASIGQAPVNSLEVTGIRDVAIASLALDTQTRSVLTRGWSFNTDYGFEIAPNAEGNLVLPAAALWASPQDRSKRFVVRKLESVGPCFWDLEKHTFDLGQSPLKVDLIWAQDFEHIPQVARDYIATRAARIFQSQVIGSDILFKYTELHEREAYASLMKLESRSKQRNMLVNEPAYNRRYNTWR